MQTRQPVFTKEKAPTRITYESIYGKNGPASKVGSNAPSKLNSKVGTKVGVKRYTKMQNAGKMLVGSHKQQFDDIPDSVSDYSKITGTRTNMFKNKPQVKEDKLTLKPNEIIMNGQGNLATIKEHNFTGLPTKKEVTDKPNNIRAPMGLIGNPRF